MIIDTDIDITSTGYIRPEALAAVDAKMPKNTVILGETMDYSTHLWLPSVSVYGNHALGAYLTVEVAKRIGKQPVRTSHSTADVAPLLALAAGMPVPDDDWYESFVFVGHLEIAALNHVFAENDFSVTAERGTVRLTLP